MYKKEARTPGLDGGTEQNQPTTLHSLLIHLLEAFKSGGLSMGSVLVENPVSFQSHNQQPYLPRQRLLLMPEGSLTSHPSQHSQQLHNCPILSLQHGFNLQPR